MPIIPHFSNECLKIIKKKDQIIWPTYDESQLEESNVVIVVQINGKKRGIINTKKDIDEDDLMKSIYDDEKIVKYFDKNKIKKKIYIKNKLVNIIV
jgi:leucyl-tRNA synthetase